jgi:vancomycin resistance protein VanJ
VSPPRRILTLASVLCTAGVLAYWAGLQWIGERWWGTAMLLYVPHAVLLAPVAVLAIAVAIVGPRRWLALHVATAVWVLVPIMGLRWSGPVAGTPGSSRLRVLTFNVANGDRSVAAVVAEISAVSPDVVVLQESTMQIDDAVAAALPGFSVRSSSQFLVASRFPVVDLYEPGKLAFAGQLRSPRFVRATIETPGGALDVYDVHPISPRDAFEEVASPGGTLGGSSERATIRKNTELRRLQVQEIARLAKASAHPVLIAGDTNLPRLSQILEDELGGWQDGFDAVGRGFGYTFPVGRHAVWMRIDRIFAGPQLRFLQLHVDEGRGSDHACVWAELEWVGKP